MMLLSRMISFWYASVLCAMYALISLICSSAIAHRLCSPRFSRSSSACTRSVNSLMAWRCSLNAARWLWFLLSRSSVSFSATFVFRSATSFASCARVLSMFASASSCTLSLPFSRRTSSSDVVGRTFLSPSSAF